MHLGLISDTHGLVRPEALNALRGVERILHAGDVGGSHVLAALAAVAPVVAIRGNVDGGAWASALPEHEVVIAGEVTIYMLHDANALARQPMPDGVRVIVSGHSHKPSVQERDGVLYVNPGSAGPKRFTLPITIAHLRVSGRGVSAEIVEIL